MVDLLSSATIFLSSLTEISAANMDSTTLLSTIVFGSTCGTGVGAGAGVRVRDGAPDPPVKDEKSDEKKPPPPAAGFGGSFLG